MACKYYIPNYTSFISLATSYLISSKDFLNVSTNYVCTPYPKVETDNTQQITIYILYTTCMFVEFKLCYWIKTVVSKKNLSEIPFWGNAFLDASERYRNCNYSGNIFCVKTPPKRLGGGP